MKSTLILISFLVLVVSVVQGFAPIAPVANKHSPSTSSITTEKTLSNSNKNSLISIDQQQCPAEDTLSSTALGYGLARYYGDDYYGGYGGYGGYGRYGGYGGYGRGYYGGYGRYVFCFCSCVVFRGSSEKCVPTSFIESHSHISPIVFPLLSRSLPLLISLFHARGYGGYGMYGGGYGGYGGYGMWDDK